MKKMLGGVLAVALMVGTASAGLVDSVKTAWSAVSPRTKGNGRLWVCATAATASHLIKVGADKALKEMDDLSTTRGTIKLLPQIVAEKAAFTKKFAGIELSKEALERISLWAGHARFISVVAFLTIAAAQLATSKYGKDWNRAWVKHAEDKASASYSAAVEGVIAHLNGLYVDDKRAVFVEKDADGAKRFLGEAEVLKKDSNVAAIKNAKDRAVAISADKNGLTADQKALVDGLADGWHADAPTWGATLKAAVKAATAKVSGRNSTTA